jgi:hypothetical protein
MIPNKAPFSLVTWSLVGIACVAGLVATGCGKHGVPLERSTVVGPPPADPAVAERAIESALARRKWVVKEKAPGRYTAELNERKHTVTIAIFYDAQNVRIDYVDSANLLYEKGPNGELIHQKYNGWVRNLSTDIRVAFTGPPVAAAPSGAPPPAPPPSAPPPAPAAAK